MKTVQEFLKVMPNLVCNMKELDAVFITYHDIPDYPDGSVKTGKAGLNITVHSGHLKYSNRLSSMEREAHQALTAVIESTEKDLVKLEGKNFFAFIYAGLSAFGKSLNYAKEIRKQNPSAKVFVLTCDCDKHAKQRVLDSAIDLSQLDDAIMTPACGGRSAMQSFLTGLIAAWPQ